MSSFLFINIFFQIKLYMITKNSFTRNIQHKTTEGDKKYT